MYQDCHHQNRRTGLSMTMGAHGNSTYHVLTTASSARNQNRDLGLSSQLTLLPTPQGPNHVLQLLCLHILDERPSRTGPWRVAELNYGHWTKVTHGSHKPPTCDYLMLHYRHGSSPTLATVQVLHGYMWPVAMRLNSTDGASREVLSDGWPTPD